MDFDSDDPIPFCYDGTDTHLKEEPYCFACHDEDGLTVVSGLKRCSRCQVAWYCSTQCQRKHFKHHRELCSQIEEDRDCEKEEAIPLRAFVDPSEDNAVAENLFETRVGGFCDLDETGNYLQARTRLANSYWNAAYDCEVKEVWEKSLFHYLEILRLGKTYRSEVRFRVPFILLYLNRDDDAFAFIRYWLNFVDSEEVRSRHKRSREGDWLYPVERNCRFLDVFEECPGLVEQEFIGPYLFALTIIKMRISAYHDAISRAVQVAFDQTGCKLIDEVRTGVLDVLAGCDISSQGRQLNQLLNMIPSFMLYDISELQEFPDLDQSQEVDEFTQGYSFPINVTFWNGIRSFFRVPLADEILYYLIKTDGCRQEYPEQLYGLCNNGNRSGGA